MGSLAFLRVGANLRTQQQRRFISYAGDSGVADSVWGEEAWG